MSGKKASLFSVSDLSVSVPGRQLVSELTFAARGGETFGVAYRGACKRGCHEELHLLPPPRGARCDVDS